MSQLRRSGLAMLLVAVVASVMTLTQVGADAASPEISGLVFRDENFDGAKASEIGEAGIEVTVTDSLGVSATTLSDANGAYTVSVGAMTGPFAVQFVVPPALDPLRPGPLGTDNRSDVRTVSAGLVSSGAATAIDFGVINPYHYCQNNPDVVTNCYVEFNQVSGPNAGGNVLVETEYLAAGDGLGSGTAEVALSQAAEIGTTYGLAYQTFNDRSESNDIIYAAAYMKRFAGYGPNGPGAIYQLDANGTVLGTLNVAAGSDPHNFTAVGSEFPDAASYAQVGKQSWGDIDISEDDTRLYAVNLFDRHLYEFDVDPTSGGYLNQTNSWALTGLPGQTCAGNIRPFAVGVNDHDVYVGSVCDGPTTSDLRAFLHRMDPSVGTFSSVLGFPLNFARENIGADSGLLANWNPWSDTWAATATGWGFPEVGNPQPILSDIEFTRGDLILGFRDRYGDQTGYAAPGTNWPADGSLYYTDAAGDVLRACRIAPGTWAIEGQPGCTVTNGGGANSGPGGVEWYDGDTYLTGSLRGHEEISLGGLAHNRVRNDTIATGYDTLDDVGGEYAFSNGLFRLDNTSGDKVGQYRIVAGVFGKAAGLGDIETQCIAAPVEIGNLVWFDADKDGFQDPGEPIVPGVTVDVWSSDGTTFIGSATTGSDGYWSVMVEPDTTYKVTFDLTGANVAGLPGITAPELLAVTSPSQGSNPELDSNGSLADGEISTMVTTGAPGDNDHSIDLGLIGPTLRVGDLVWFDVDDDGTPDDGEPGIAGLLVELWVETNDVAGFDAATDAVTATTATDPNGVYAFGTLVEGLTYYVAIPGDQSTQTLTVSGATVDPATLASSTGGNTGNNDIDNVDDGEPVFGFMSVTGPIDAVVGAEPTGEVDSNTTPDRDAEAYVEALAGLGLIDRDDNSSNLTVDLGLTQSTRIGNLVWLDGVVGDAGFNDGEADAGELGIGGVTVELWLDDDDDGAFDPDKDVFVDTTTTSSTGAYWFDDVDPGTYIVAIPSGQTGQNVGLLPIDLADLSSSGGQSDADVGDDDVDDGDLLGAYSSVSAPFVVDRADNPIDELGDFADATLGAAETAANLGTSYYADSHSDLTVDLSFVEIPLYQIGNLVWLDIDDDGVAEDGEPGIGGVHVELWQSGGVTPYAETDTDVDGHYWFPDLPAGDYSIVIPGGQTGQTAGLANFDLNDTFVSTTAVADPDDPSDVDNDSNGAGTSGALDVTSAEISVGDPDLYDPTEPTDETLRDDLATDDDGAGVADDQSNVTLDVGFVQPLRIGNLVWLDDGAGTDADEDDGQADALEAGIPGVLVQLLDDQGDVVAETVTDADGLYVFDDLRSGDFQIGIPSDQSPVLGPLGGIDADALDGLRSSTGASATPETTDDDDDGVDFQSGFLGLGDVFTVDYAAEASDEAGDFGDATSGAAEVGIENLTGIYRPDANSNLEIDFGLSPIPEYRIGNLVWEDYDDDGLAEPGEPGIEGVLVQLLDDQGDVIAETVSDAAGHYAFDGLLAGDYQVRIPLDQTPELGALTGIVAGALDDLESSGTPDTDPDSASDEDHDNDGASDSAGPTSGVLTVGEGTDHEEITGEVSHADGVTTDEDGALRDDRSNLAVDLGFFRGLRLGNQVFLDGLQSDGPTYDNGVFDLGEVGIGGVTVELWLDDGDSVFEPAGDDTFVSDTTTDTEGNYVFDDLEADTPYFVAVESVPSSEPGDLSSRGAGLAVTPLGADNDDDGDPAAGYASVTDVFELSIGAASGVESDTEPADPFDDAEAEANAAGAFYPDGNSELAIDLGFIDVPLYRVGNLVWNDLDDDGQADGFEPGIEGVLVQLLDDQGDVFAETVTDADGRYAFENLAAGEYSVRIPEDQLATLGEQPTVDPLALDGHQSSSHGEEADPEDHGDNNDNGTGTGDWVSGTVVLGDTLAPTGDEPTDETVRFGDVTDDDPDGIGGWPDQFSNLSVDFGFYKLALGNQVWFDTNNDGVAGLFESGINGVTVVLLQDTIAGFVPVDSTVTATIDGVDGLYSFDGLIDGETYKVEIPATELGEGGVLEGHRSSNDPVGGPVDPDGDESTANDGADNVDDGVDQAAPGDAIATLPITVHVGDEPLAESPDNATGIADANENLSVDLGVVMLTLGNTVFADTDENGVQDIGTEPGIAEVLVELWEVDDAGQPVGDEPVQVMTTDDAGHYLFISLTPGDYVVRIPDAMFEPGAPLDGQVSTAGNGIAAPDPDDGLDVDDNGDPYPFDGWVQTLVLTLDWGQAPEGEVDVDPTGVRDVDSDLAVDLGFHEAPPQSLGNLVWHDLDDDGVVDPGEPGLTGVPVDLLDVTGTVVTSTVTDATGHYLFVDLAPGEYAVQIPASAFVDSAALHGYVSSDASAPTDPDDDRDGVDDGADAADPAGSVVSELVMLYPSLEPAEGPDGETDVPLDGHGATVDGPIADVDSNLTVDLGFYALSLGNVIFADDDNDGVFEPATEEGLPGVDVNLVDATGNVLDTTVTDSSGHYTFDGLVEGDYGVTVPAPEFADDGSLDGYYSSTGNGDAPDPDDGLDNVDDGDPVSGSGSAVSAELVTLTVGDEPEGETVVATGENLPVDDSANLTVDLGFYTASLTTFIWIDTDDDGVLDPDERPLGGVEVQLLDAETGAVVAVGYSDPDGRIHFDGLEEGTYILEVTPANFARGGPLEDYASTTGTTGLDDGTDPASAGGGVRSGPIDVLAVGSDTTMVLGAEVNAAFGFTPVGSISGTVWQDTDRDGVQDSSEPGVPGVTIELLDETNAVAATATTGADGGYVFADLPPATHRVRIPTLPNGTTMSPQGLGDIATGSDFVVANRTTANIVLGAGQHLVDIDAGLIPPAVVTATAPSGPLAFTGGSVGVLIVAAATLILTGAGLVLVRRRRLDG